MGWPAASDASTGYTNPAGLVNLTERQLVFNALGITGNAKFTGSSISPNFPFPFPVQQSGTAKSSIEAFMPSFYYSTPLSNAFTFGFNFTVPFGLGTDYGQKSIVRYAATRSEVVGINIGPSLGYKLNDVISFGAGLDAVYLAFELSNMFGPPLSFPADSALKNKLDGWGLAWHAGTLVNVSPQTRLGFNYHSKVSIQTSGRSVVTLANGNTLRTDDQRTKAALPARAQLSLQQDFSERWTGMATIFYTNWQSFNRIIMENTMTPSGAIIPVNIPFNYHNTFDYAIGTSYKANNHWLLRAHGRAGVQFLNTPSNDKDRNVADPIGKGTVLAAGLQYQYSKNIWFDLGVAHTVFQSMPVKFANPLVALHGKNNAQTTAIGGQVTWNIA